MGKEEPVVWKKYDVTIVTTLTVIEDSFENAIAGGKRLLKDMGYESTILKVERVDSGVPRF